MTARSRFVFIILASFFTFYILHFTFIKSAFAQTTTQPSVNQLTPITIPNYVSPTSPLYTDLIVNNMFHTFSCLAIGQSLIGQPCLTYQMTRNAQGMIQGIPVLSQVNLSGGTLGAISSVIGSLYKNPPVRTADYLAVVGRDLGIVREAHAQGVVGSGQSVLSPYVNLWLVSRNIAYVIMIVVFVIIGLMVMFRNRINPQTVITAQTALPGLVIGLILITFSYFLAGFISDFAFLGTNLVGYYFTSANHPTAPTTLNLVQDIKDKNMLSLFTPFIKVANSGNISGALGAVWNDLADPNNNRPNPFDLDPQKVLTDLAALVTTQLILPFGNLFGGVGQIIGGLAAFGSTAIAPVQVVSLALSFIAMAILIYAMLKLLLKLINIYITIIVLTVTAPFQFLAAALPGRQSIATGWIVNMLANILAFPAVLAGFYFAAFLLGPANPSPIFKVAAHTQIMNTSLVPAVYAQDASSLPTASLPLFGGLSVDIIKFLLGFGVLVALPSLPDVVVRTVGRVGVAGQLIGQEISGSYGAGRGYAGQFQGGIGGFAGQAGRLTTATGQQIMRTPTGWEQVSTKTPGQISRARAGLSGLKGLFGRASGGGGGAVE